MPIDPKIFKKYDIRGLASGANAILTAEAAEKIGRAFATYLTRPEAGRGEAPLRPQTKTTAVKQEKPSVVVGRDNRQSSSDLQSGLVEGLRAAGCQVINLGLVATPVVYWHAVNRGNGGGVMITGSHLAADQNGFKLCVGNRTLYGPAIQLIRATIERGDFVAGDGSVTVNVASCEEYIADLSQRIPPSQSLRVVIDCGNGIGGLFAPQLLAAWGHQIVAGLYLEPDATYPHHRPDPQEAKNMRDLGEKVKEVGADVGIAFDGDADRMGAVDENGNMIVADRLLALLAVDMLKRHPGAAVVADVLSSQVLFDAIESAGGHAFMAASGHSLVKEVLHEKKALLGGEMSGHIFLGENYFGFDDGFLAAGRLLQLIAASGQTLSQLDNALPRLYSTPEYRPHCPDEDKQKVIDGVAALLQGRGEVETVDGFRIKFARGWGILRASNTEPVLSLRFEGQTETDALAYRQLFADALRAFPQVKPLE